jgi:hypothetical protein
MTSTGTKCHRQTVITALFGRWTRCHSRGQASGLVAAGSAARTRPT